MPSNTKYLSKIRDNSFSKLFYNDEYFDVLNPLISSILPNGSMSCFIGEKDDPMPETTSTTLLFLYRNSLIDGQKVKKMQEYLLSTNSEIANSKQIKPANLINKENCAWSSIEGNNVWSTAQVLWALIATNYKGKYLDYVLKSIEWIIANQYGEGGWAFSSHRDNLQNTYITCITVYTLKLSLDYHDWSSDMKKNIENSIEKGCQFILSTKNKRKDIWGTDKEIFEPTTTAMSIWALKNCYKDVQSVNPIIQNAIRFLKKDIYSKNVWDNKVMVDGILPNNGAKVLQGYSPSIALILLQLNVSPFDEVILKPLNLLLNTKTAKGWDFISTKEQDKSATGFLKPNTYYVGSGKPMTFTTALALWTIESWHKKVIEHTINIQNESGKIRLTLLKDYKNKAVDKTHLLILLIITNLISLVLYFWGLNTWFDQSIIDTIKNLDIKEFSDFLESILKLLFIPIMIFSLSINFYKNGKFTFETIRKTLKKIF